MTAPLDTCSFFARDSLLHTEVPYRPLGFQAEAAPFRLRSDDWCGLMLLVCLLLLLSLMRRTGGKMGSLFMETFMPLPGKKDDPVADDPLRYSTRLVAILLISLAAAMTTFTITQHDAGFYLFPETPYLLLGAFFLLWIAYFWVKRTLTNFVNWVFFRDEKIFTWQRALTFIFVVEAMLSVALMLVVVFLPLSLDEMLLAVLFVIILVKIMLLLKAKQIFFPKMYGTFHLIVYFCTLEMMPLLVVQQVLPCAEMLTTLKLW